MKKIFLALIVISLVTYYVCNKNMNTALEERDIDSIEVNNIDIDSINNIDSIKNDAINIIELINDSINEKE